MKDREYFERLISDMLDSPLPPNKADDLEAHLRQAETTDTAAFLKDAIDQSRLLRSIPTVSLNAELPGQQFRKYPSVRRLWNIRLSIPAPAAVAAAVVLVALLIVGLWNPRFTGSETQPDTADRSVRYVQIERLKPASAVEVSPEKTNSAPNKGEVQ
jgi:anti-sigma factor RsiW